MISVWTATSSRTTLPRSMSTLFGLPVDAGLRARWRQRSHVEQQVASAWRVAAATTASGAMVGFCRAISDGVSLAVPRRRVRPAGAPWPRPGQGHGRRDDQRRSRREFRWLLHTDDAHGCTRGSASEKPDATYMERPPAQAVAASPPRRRPLAGATPQVAVHSPPHPRRVAACSPSTRPCPTESSASAHVARLLRSKHALAIDVGAYGPYGCQLGGVERIRVAVEHAEVGASPDAQHARGRRRGGPPTPRRP